VKTALREENIPFEEVELSSNLELLRKIKETTGRRTVPQVFVGGQLIGGADETIALMKEGDFQMEVLKAGNTLPLPPDLQQALLQAREEQQVCSSSLRNLPAYLVTGQHHSIVQLAQPQSIYGFSVHLQHYSC
jgi:glutaredoxin 3